MAENPPLWEPFQIEDTFGPTSIGGDNRIKRVRFHILGADDSYVDIPYSKFNTANVAAAIEEHVSRTIDVLQLRGPTY